ncbi:type II secretion system F family protein [Yinghuangia seranimata]|uniref:type II secretion system F family protein n=1 Tax=Yinghuangia seranimata TaxID=408067 RepID=UPI00248AA0D3|nr:type II secretion system F family protein [Yinghuangia seranimata]MDI2127922.1 type II secretion system F family protein [Yinghuangia seranimata]
MAAPALVAVAILVAGARAGRTRVGAIAVVNSANRKRDSPSAPAELRVRVVAWSADPGVRTAAVVLAATGVTAFALWSPVAALLGPPAAIYAARRRRRAQARRDADRVRAEAADLAGAMVAELRAGQPVFEAFTLAAGTLDGPMRGLLVEAVAVARVGGDIPAALTRTASAPGAEALARVAACWRVAAERGAGFATALDRVAAGLRAEEAGRGELTAELAGARSTARLLAGLPLFGVLLGTGIGAHPTDVLLRTPLGVLCLTLGLALTAAGLTWTDRIADHACRGW